MKSFLQTLYNSTYMPMHYYHENELIATYPDWSIQIDAMTAYINSTVAQGLTFDYFAVDDLVYIGIVRNPDTNEAVLLGPVSFFPLTKEMIENIRNSYGLDDEEEINALAFFDRTPTFLLHQFLSIMSLIHMQLNKEYIDIQSIYLSKNAEKELAIGKEHALSLMERKENKNYHDTYYFEQEYYALVEAGDVAGLEKMILSMPSISEGAVAHTFIRQAKNIFISSVTLYTRHSIAGGLDIETAYQLSDTYIQEMEKLTDTNAVLMLNQTAVLDFTRRVAEAKVPNGMSPEIFMCIHYISNHVNQNIRVAEIAKELNIDRSTLSKKFKRELGFNISAYIMRRKLEEAKSLLTYTDKTISEISEYLCFSTQAYFQNVFKKKYGMTPREYRLKSS